MVYEFICLPFGIACAPRVCTKIMKPLIASLRLMGHESCDYIDDSLLVGRTFQECIDNVQARASLTQSLGFTINDNKSILTPTKQIDFWGFHLDSDQMTISIPPSKVESKIASIRKLLRQQSPTIRDVAKVIGLLVSCELAVPYRPLFRRTIENYKNLALSEHGGDYEAKISITKDVICDLNWWVTQLPIAFAPMHRHEPNYVIETDASSLGWCAHVNGRTTGGRWSKDEAIYHINWLELKACLLALQSFFSEEHDISIHLKSDNVTAVAGLPKTFWRPKI